MRAQLRVSKSPSVRRLGALIPPQLATSAGLPALASQPVEGSPVGYTLPVFDGTQPLSITTRFRVNGADVGALNASTATPAAATATQPMLVRVTVTNAAGSAVFDSPSLTIVAAGGGAGSGVWDIGPWRAPGRDSDNGLLTDLAGYALYLSQNEFAGVTGTRVVIANPATLTYQATGLSSGRHYAWLAAYDTAGNEGPEYRLGHKDIA